VEKRGELDVVSNLDPNKKKFSLRAGPNRLPLKETSKRRTKKRTSSASLETIKGFAKLKGTEYFSELHKGGRNPKKRGEIRRRKNFEGSMATLRERN